MPAFRTLNGELHNDRSMIIHTLARTTERAPSHSFRTVLAELMQTPDATTTWNHVVRCRLCDLWWVEDAPHQIIDEKVADQVQQLAWLLGLIWAGLVEHDYQRFDRFGAVATAALERLPADATNDQAWTILSDWLAEVQPGAIDQCRRDFAVWLEEYLCEPGIYRVLDDTDPNQVLADLQQDRPVPRTPQLVKLLNLFFSNHWFDEQGDEYYAWNIPTINAVHSHLTAHLTTESATV